jgi:hypothetical protein
MQEWVLPTAHLYFSPTFNWAESAQRYSRGDLVLHPQVRLNDNRTRPGLMNGASVVPIMDMTSKRHFCNSWKIVSRTRGTHAEPKSNKQFAQQSR